MFWAKKFCELHPKPEFWISLSMIGQSGLSFGLNELLAHIIATLLLYFKLQSSNQGKKYNRHGFYFLGGTKSLWGTTNQVSFGWGTPGQVLVLFVHRSSSRIFTPFKLMFWCVSLPTPWMAVSHDFLAALEENGAGQVQRNYGIQAKGWNLKIPNATEIRYY